MIEDSGKKFYYRENSDSDVSYVPIPHVHKELLMKVLEQNQKIIDLIISSAKERIVTGDVMHKEEDNE